MTAPTSTSPPPPEPPAPPMDAGLLLPRGWPELVDVPAPDGRVLAAIGIAGVATDLAIRSDVGGLAGALVVAVPAVGLLLTRRVPNRRAWPLLLAVPLLGVVLATRTAEWLVFLDVLAAGGLLVVGASLAREGDPLDLTIPGLAGRAVHALLHGALALGYVVRGLRRPGGGGRSAAAVLRGALLGAPVLLVIGLLLGAADPVFASFFRLPANGGDLALHAVLLATGAWAAAGLFRLAAGEPYDLAPTTCRPLGVVEATTVLTGLVAVLAAFTASQVVAAVGGDAYVRRTAGLSYAEYARRGFFPLLAAAALTLGVLVAVRASVDRARAARLTWLSQAAVGLTLLLVAGAVRRLGLYERAYGLTVLRLVAVLFALWIAAVFVLLALSLAGVCADRAWFVPASLGLAVVGLLGLTVADPEAYIVRRNVERHAGTDRLDVRYLSGLSDDAVPALVDVLPRLPDEDAALLRAVLCADQRDVRDDGGSWGWNRARSAATAARAEICGP